MDIDKRASARGIKTTQRVKYALMGFVASMVGMLAFSQAATYYGWNPSTGLETLHGALVAGGQLPVLSGCATMSASVGGAWAGQFVTSGTTCALTVTLPSAAPNGWACAAQDVTTPSVRFNQTAASTTGCTVTGQSAGTAGDLIIWNVRGY